MPTLERRASTSDLDGKMNGDVEMDGHEEFEEIEYIEEEEEEEMSEDDPVVNLEVDGFQDNDTIQILSEDESELPMSPGKTADKPAEEVFGGGLWADAATSVFPPNWPEQRYFEHIPERDLADQTDEMIKAAKVHEELQEEMKSDDEKGEKESSKGTFKVGFHVQFCINRYLVNGCFFCIFASWILYGLGFAMIHHDIIQTIFLGTIYYYICFLYFYNLLLCGFSNVCTVWTFSFCVGPQAFGWSYWDSCGFAQEEGLQGCRVPDGQWRSQSRVLKG